MELDLFNNAEFGTKYITESGKETVYCGKLKKGKNETQYYIFMFKDDMEISLYTGAGIGPYAFSVGSGCIFNPMQYDNIKLT